ncbi:E3 ubiquitin-protein ligase RNF183-like [Bombina bombina]|uniref:E3 ubiquitin-protein ligase RNF183-like n=1 Tax=Bombina bombina TaxID=8345 RepID=UPI00235ACC87|nr:E3 ubiquitin-protein ligase RNF183-like [Bombina bombina]
MEQEYNIPECTICFATYDNIFRTPLLLPCGHTFCMECLCKMCVFQKELETFCCPMCRAPVIIPLGGIPKLPPNMNIVSQFPSWMGQLQDVWLEGSKLCWKKGYGQTCVTNNQNSVSHYPAQQEDNVIITIYLLGSSPVPFNRPGDLVMISHQPYHQRCNFLFQNYGCVVWIFICCVILLFFMVFFPMYLRF